MLLYISTEDHETLFKQWLDEQGVFFDFVDYSNYPTFVSALNQNKALPNYRYILFYLSEAPQAAEPVQEAVAHIQRYYHARIIIFAPQSVETSGLFGRLVEMGLRELVQVSEDTDLNKALAECLSQDGKDFISAAELSASAHIEKAQASARPQLVIPQGFVLSLGIAGTQTRVGTTIQAFQMYHALKALGFCPCIIDTQRAFLQVLAALYSEEAVIDGSFITVREITFANDIQIGTPYNAFIFDVGVLNENNAEILKDCALRFLCSGSKAWELPHLADALTAYPNIVQHCIFSFSSENEKTEALEALNLLDKPATAEFAPWCPDIWGFIKSDWHEQLLLPLLQEVLSS